MAILTHQHACFLIPSFQRLDSCRSSGAATVQEEEAVASAAAACNSLRLHAQQLLNQAAEKLERFVCRDLGVGLVQ